MIERSSEEVSENDQNSFSGSLTGEELFKKYSNGEVPLRILVGRSLTLLAERLTQLSPFGVNHNDILYEFLGISESSKTDIFNKTINEARVEKKKIRGQMHRIFEGNISDADKFYMPFLNYNFGVSNAPEIPTQPAHVSNLINDILEALKLGQGNVAHANQDLLKSLVCWLWYEEIVRQITVAKARSMVLDTTIQPPEKNAKPEEAYNSTWEYWKRKLYGTGIAGQEGILFAQHVYYLARERADSLASQIFDDKSKEVANLIMAVITIKTNTLTTRLARGGKYTRLSEIRPPILKALFDGNLEEAKKLFIAFVNTYGRDVVTPYTLKLLSPSDDSTEEGN